MAKTNFTGKLAGVVIISSITLAAALAEQAPAVYSSPQAAAGRAAYESTCIKCHTETLIPAADATYMGQRIPPLAGPEFLKRWGPQTTNDLAMRIKTAISGFPPGNLTGGTYLDITAYVLQVNGARAGDHELSPGAAILVGAAVGTATNSGRR